MCLLTFVFFFICLLSFPLLNIEVGGSGWFSDEGKSSGGAIILVGSTFSTVVNELLIPFVVISSIDKSTSDDEDDTHRLQRQC